MRKSTTFLLFSIVFILVSCQKESNNLTYKFESLDLPETPYNYSNQEISPENSWRFSALSAKVNDDVATLGRVLFYDEILSLNNTTACGSCHEQGRAFSQPSEVSTGFDGSQGTRNASTIVNLIDQNTFFWDARESDLETMVTKPLVNHIEMGLDKMSDLEIELAVTEHYPQLFDKAFGDREVTKERISKALSQFLASMISEDSKFDRVFLKSDAEESFTPLEEAGRDIFFGRAQCAGCHFYNNDFKGWWEGDFGGGAGFDADIGLDIVYTDKGLGSLIPGMEGRFKIPTLRNIALTPPYMHDGRFQTLDEVYDHYSEGVKKSPNLHSMLKDEFGEPVKLNLTKEEREALTAFLGTLTDEIFVNNEMFSNPFKR